MAALAVKDAAPLPIATVPLTTPVPTALTPLTALTAFLAALAVKDAAPLPIATVPLTTPVPTALTPLAVNPAPFVASLTLLDTIVLPEDRTLLKNPLLFPATDFIPSLTVFRLLGNKLLTFSVALEAKLTILSFIPLKKSVIAPLAIVKAFDKDL